MNNTGKASLNSSPIFWALALALALVPCLRAASRTSGNAHGVVLLSGSLLDPTSRSGLATRRVRKALLAVSLLVVIVVLDLEKIITLGQIFNLLGAAFCLAMFIYEGLATALTDTWIVGRKNLTKAFMVRTTIQTFHAVVGGLILLVQLAIASVPCVTEAHTRCLFNIEFSERLRVATIFAKEQNRRNILTKEKRAR